MPLSNSLFESLLNRLGPVQVTEDYWRGLLNQILQLGDLRLLRCLREELEDLLVTVDLTVGVRLVEVLPLRSRIEGVHLQLRVGQDGVVRRRRRYDLQLFRERFTLSAELVMIVHHPQIGRA